MSRNRLTSFVKLTNLCHVVTLFSCNPFFCVYAALWRNGSKKNLLTAVFLELTPLLVDLLQEPSLFSLFWQPELLKSLQTWSFALVKHAWFAPTILSIECLWIFTDNQNGTVQPGSNSLKQYSIHFDFVVKHWTELLPLKWKGPLCWTYLIN